MTAQVLIQPTIGNAQALGIKIDSAVIWIGFFPDQESAIREMLSIGDAIRNDAKSKLAKLHEERLTTKLKVGDDGVRKP